MKDFGILIKTLRKKAALTQKEFADQLGIDSSNISKWERNKTLPDVSILPQIASVLNITCDDLLHPTETLEKMSKMSDGNTPATCDNTIHVPTNDHESKAASESTAIIQKRKMFTPKRILPTCMLIIVLVISICVHAYSQTNFTFIEARTNVETQYGPAYELVYYHKTKYPTHVFVEHSSNLQEAWENGTYTDSTENVLIVSYYLSIDSVDNWDKAYHRSFYLKNHKED